MSTSHISRFFLTLVALTAIALGAVLPSAAHASSAACALGSHDVTWSPGVTNTVATHDVRANTTWNCTQILRAPLFTTASSRAEFSAPFSCINLFSTEPTSWTITWSDGIDPATSTFEYTATVVPAAGNLVVVANGSITEGRFSGQAAEAEFVLTNLAATLGDQCRALPGVTNANGTSTLVIL